MSLEREVQGSNLGLVKSDTVLPTACHRCHVSKKAVLPGSNDAEMGPANSLHVSAYHSEYYERFDLIYHIPVVFFLSIILIVFTGGAEFTVWQNGTQHASKLEINSLSVFLVVHLF